MPDAIPHAIVITYGDIELAPIHQCNVGMYSVKIIRAYGKELV